MVKNPPPTADHPGVIAMPPLLFLGFLAAGILLHLVWRIPVADSIATRLGGVVLLLTGISLVAWGRRTMLRAGTNIRPTQPATALVVTGPFRYSRNPLYIALLLLYAGIALAVGTLWPFVLLAILLPLLHWGIVRREERYLERKFGEAYARYRAVTRRWI
jgi:protein-S-isoprenylcysteine O-methyltransferase Ste14